MEWDEIFRSILFVIVIYKLSDWIFGKEESEELTK